MKRRRYIGIILLLTLLMLVGCQQEDREVKVGTYKNTHTKGWTMFCRVSINDDGTAYFEYVGYSSHVISGKYDIKGKYLTITEVREKRESSYVFEIEGDTLKFVPRKSSEFPLDDESVDWNDQVYQFEKE